MQKENTITSSAQDAGQISERAAEREAVRRGYVYRSFNHGKVYNVEGRGNVTGRTLKRERRERERLAENTALVGKIIAGAIDGKYWIGTVKRAFKNLKLEVVTRAGNRLIVEGGEEYSFEKWDIAVNDPENNFTPEQIIP